MPLSGCPIPIPLRKSHRRKGWGPERHRAPIHTHLGSRLSKVSVPISIHTTAGIPSPSRTINLMRVIAGLYRSRPLLSPRGTLTRPTSDRLRETLFNILQPRIHGARFADLYAGTGAVGIEALSRGAEHVLFAERAEPALATLRGNLKSLGITIGYTLESRSAIAALDKLIDRSIATPTTPKFNLIFLDPPYEAAADYTNTLALLGSQRAQTTLAPGALVITEHSSKLPLPPDFGSLHQTRTLRQGDAALTFYIPTAPVN